ncbi:MAG: signal peptidase II [Clostridiales bacterium]|nr:signal peptidase II [Clostridiales bacterium]
MNKKKMMIVFLLLSAVLVVIDQLTKNYIVRSFELHTGVSFINDFFSFYYVQNKGSAFSFLADKSWGIWVLTGVSTVLALIVLYFMIKSIKLGENLVACCMVLLFSGAVGNLIDRYRLHYVVDFIRFDFGSYTFPIFNIADICAVLGTIMLISMLIFLPKRVEKIW